MTTNKPEVFIFDCHGHNAPAYSCNKPADNSGEYVRLSDYEALQAECNVLVGALESLIKGYVSLLEGGIDRITSLDGDCDSIPDMLRDARSALAAHRKQGVMYD